jgi:hypothetical protein
MGMLSYSYGTDDDSSRKELGYCGCGALMTMLVTWFTGLMVTGFLRSWVTRIMELRG